MLCYVRLIKGPVLYPMNTALKEILSTGLKEESNLRNLI